MWLGGFVLPDDVTANTRSLYFHTYSCQSIVSSEKQHLFRNNNKLSCVKWPCLGVILILDVVSPFHGHFCDDILLFFKLLSCSDSSFHLEVLF